MDSSSIDAQPGAAPGGDVRVAVTVRLKTMFIIS